MTIKKTSAKGINTLWLAYSTVYVQRLRKYCSSQLLNVWSLLKSTHQVDIPLLSEVKSSRMFSSRPPSTWGHFSLKSGHISLPQRLPGLAVGEAGAVFRHTHLPHRQQITAPAVKTIGSSMAAAADYWTLSPHADIVEFSWPETKVQPLEPQTSRRIYRTGSGSPHPHSIYEWFVVRTGYPDPVL